MFARLFVCGLTFLRVQYVRRVRRQGRTMARTQTGLYRREGASRARRIPKVNERPTARESVNPRFTRAKDTDVKRETLQRQSLSESTFLILDFISNRKLEELDAKRGRGGGRLTSIFFFLPFSGSKADISRAVVPLSSNGSRRELRFSE